MSIVVPCGVVVNADNLEIVSWNLGEYKIELFISVWFVECVKGS